MNEKLYQLLQKAELDFELRKRIWAAKDAKDPALALCELCTAEGFPLTVGGLFAEGEEFFCNLFPNGTNIGFGIVTICFCWTINIIIVMRVDDNI